MKILFVISQLDFADHIAIAYLSATAKERRHETFICNLATEDLGAAVGKIKPDIVGYSANILGYKKIVEAHRQAVKRRSFVSIRLICWPAP